MAIAKKMPCKFCDAPSFYLCETFNEHSATTWIYNYRCTACGLVFVGNDVDTEELVVAYASLDSSTYYAEIHDQNLKKLQTSADHLLQLIDRAGKVIDLGTGNGDFIKVLSEEGFKNISCHELPGADLSAIEAMECTIYRDLDYSSVPSGTFDAITFLDVAEHVLDPRHLFASCSRMLTEGGWIYFHTPVVTKLDRTMHLALKLPVLGRMGRIWQRGRTNIFHLRNYTRRSLLNLLAEAGFQDIHIEVRNELSWPVARYIRVFLLAKQGLPTALAPFLAPFFYPFFATNVFNANKAIVWARKKGPR